MADPLILSLYRWHRARPFRRRDAKGRLLQSSARSSLMSAREEIARYGIGYMRGLVAARAGDA